MQRRQFLSRAATGAALTALSAGRVFGANDRVRVGLIGCGVRGNFVGRLMNQVPGTAFVAACDVYEPHANRAAEWAGPDCRAERDFRRVLDRKEVDAVLVATPDHWHAIPTVLACQAGKDVYVEKPLAHNVREGRAMVTAARKYDRVVQTGTQHRSSPHYAEAARIVQSGELGKVHFVRLWNYTNMYPNGIGAAADSDPPAGLDWDFYLGPAPKVPFNRNRFLGTFRWFWDYAGGFLTDFGTHRHDSMHQVMGVDAPLTVTASGGRYELKDGGETPDVLQVTYEYPGFVLSYESCTLSGQGVMGRTPGKRYYRALGPDDRPHGEAFYGTNGTLLTDRIGYEVIPELARRQRGGGGGGGARMPRKEAAAEDRTDLHVKNFIECVRSRQRPVADVEIGHKATIVGHLGNIACRTGRKLRWDAAKEEIVGDAEASALLGRVARKPWDLI
jgi:predicted dehydrogenase